MYKIGICFGNKTDGQDISKILSIIDRIRIPNCFSGINKTRVDFHASRGEDGNIHGYVVSTESDGFGRCLISELNSVGFDASYIQ